jgi:hypothetical protein
MHEYILFRKIERSNIVLKALLLQSLQIKAADLNLGPPAHKSRDYSITLSQFRNKLQPKHRPVKVLECYVLGVAQTVGYTSLTIGYTSV